MKKTFGLLLAAVIGLGLSSRSPAAEKDADELAKKAEAVLAKHCYGCHGDGGFAESDFYVLDHGSLVPNRVDPGKPEQSLLIKKIRSGQMPKDSDPLPTTDQKVLEEWIRAGAADFSPHIKRDFISPNTVLDLLATDLKVLNDDDRAFARYFTIAHLYNADRSDDQLETYRRALSKLVNSLSWRPEIVQPTAIDAEKTVFRIDLRTYKWSERIWNEIAAANPYGVIPDTKSAKYCANATGSALPLIRADWFVFAASRPPLYHEILQLPQTVAELEKMLQIEVAENIRTKAVHRAGFTESGVSDNNRLIERHRSELTRGAYWKSYDFANSEGLKSLIGHPLGPKGCAENAFEHDGGEIIFNLPNGLQAYLLIDAKGKRIDKGPLQVVHDDAQKGRAVVNGISCMSCHSQGMILKQDVIRAHVEANQASFTKDEVARVRAMYPRDDTFAELQREDANRFAEAVKKTGGRLGEKDAVVTLAKRFEANLDLKLAAAEAGLPVHQFLAGLDKSKALSRDLGLLKVKGQTIKRDLFAGMFGTIVRDMRLGTFRPASRLMETNKVFFFDGHSRIQTPLERFAPVTLEAWINPVPSDDPGQDKGGRFIMGSDIKFNSGISIFLRSTGARNSATLLAQYLPHPGRHNEVSSNEPVLAFNTWSHVAAVFGEHQTIIFLDGKEVGRGEATQKSGGTRFAIGAAGEDNLGMFFVGSIRSLRISRGERYTGKFDPPKAFEKDDMGALIYDANRSISSEPTGDAKVADRPKSSKKKSKGTREERVAQKPGPKKKGAMSETTEGRRIADLSGKQNDGILHGVEIVEESDEGE